MISATFSVIEVDRLGQAHHLDHATPEGIISQIEIDQLLDDLGPAHRLAVMPRGALPGWKARGNIFLVPAELLRENWHQTAGIVTESTNPRYLLVRFDCKWWGDALAPIAGAFGLTEMESRLLDELAEFGDFDDAVEKMGSRFNPARNALTRLRHKHGVRNLAELVNQALMLMSPSTAFEMETLDELLARSLNLSQPQFAILRSLADGTPRKLVAAEAGRSLSSVKSLLSSVFTDFALENAGALSALLGQARMVGEHFVTPDRDTDLVSSDLIGRKIFVSDRQVGYSLYGEAPKPVAAILHSTITCRHPPTRLVQQLLQDGWRVLAVDRPGFGETDSATNADIDAHIAAAAADMQAVAAQEEIEDLILIARGSGQMAIALGNVLETLVAGAILVNPTPPVAHSTVDRGPLGAIKRRFARNSASVRLMIGLLLNLATPQRLRHSMRRAFSQSPPDLAALDDPFVVADYLAATRPLSLNLDGFVVENVSWASGWEPRPKFRGDNWKILLGGHFVLHDPVTTRKYFEGLLPKAHIQWVPNAGQMLIFSHPEKVAACAAETRWSGASVVESHTSIDIII